MELFEFILILVLITTVGKVLVAVGGPLVDKLGDLARELAASRGDGGGTAVDGEVVEELERRLGRIEDRLDFLEQLRAPEQTRALGDGRLDRGGGPRETVRPGSEPERDPAPTDERTAGES